MILHILCLLIPSFIFLVGVKVGILYASGIDNDNISDPKDGDEK